MKNTQNNCFFVFALWIFHQAVKRSRVKSKQRAVQTQDRVENLKDENNDLETRIEEKRKQIQTLKELFLETASRKPFSMDQKMSLATLLAEDDDWIRTARNEINDIIWWKQAQEIRVF